MKFNPLLRIMSLPFPLHPPGEAPVKVPPRYHVYEGLEAVPEEVLREVARSYARVFSEPPWNEEWESEDVLEKIRRELRYPSCLTTMDGDEEWKVGGFAWGAVVPREEAARRTVEAHRFEQEESRRLIEEGIKKHLKGEKVFFLDEVAVLRPFRGGMSPIQFLVRPVLEKALAEGATEGIGWTSWSSKIAPLSLYLGFSTKVAETEGIVLLYNPDLRPLVKIAQNVDGRSLERLIGLASKVVGKRG
jgi:hypothetical protein